MSNWWTKLLILSILKRHERKNSQLGYFFQRTQKRVPFDNNKVDEKLWHSFSPQEKHLRACPFEMTAIVTVLQHPLNKTLNCRKKTFSSVGKERERTFFSPFPRFTVAKKVSSSVQQNARKSWKQLELTLVSNLNLANANKQVFFFFFLFVPVTAFML